MGVVYSQQTAQFYGGEQARAKVEDAALGVYQALVEARIPFEMVHDLKLDSLDSFQTLVLPNVAALSDQQCGLLRKFVERGGGLVATHETSLYDEWGTRRSDFGLKSLFGASAVKVEGPMQNAYWNVEPGSALVKGFENAGRIINGVHRVVLKDYSKDRKSPLTLVPSYPDLPMEEVYARVPKTDEPGVIATEIGRGRCVYFPWDIDRTFWEVLDVDHGALLRNAVTWATNEAPLVEVLGHGVLDIAVWEQAHSMTVNLVNLTNPMMMKGPVREIIAVGSQEVRVRIPEGRKVTGVRLLTLDRKPKVVHGQGHITVTVPSIELLEVVAIDF